MRVRSVAACVILASCLVVQAGVAQKVKSEATQPTFGLVAGANFATFNGSDATGAKTLTGLAFGAQATFSFSPTLFFQPQILYSMKGAQQTDTSGTFKLKLNYIEAPLLLGLRLASARNPVRPYIMVGPTVAYLASCKVNLSAGGVSGEADCASDATNSFDYGVTGGLGIEMATGRVTLSAAARYFLGLAEPVKNSNIKNAGFNVSVGAAIPLGH
jgi:Ca2+-binding RTX toxin-like protein